MGFKGKIRKRRITVHGISVCEVFRGKNEKMLS
jgi:hypothetical protein